MGFFSKFEGKMEDTFEGAADRIANAPISPVQIAKKAEKKMRREKMVGAGKQYAPTLYTVLVNPDDDHRLFGYYPTLAGETETYLAAKAAESGLVMDGQPLVRFMVDDGLRHGKFEVIAEAVAAPLIEQLRQEEMERYGIASPAPQSRGNRRAPGRDGAGAAAPGWSSQFPDQEPAYNAYDNTAFDDGEAPYDTYDDSVPYDNYDAPAAQNAFGAEAFTYDAPEAMPGNAHDDGNACGRKPPLPYVPEDEIDYSIDYGEYTFNSQDFEDYRKNGPAATPVPNAAGSAHFADANTPGAPISAAPAGAAGAVAGMASAAAGVAGGALSPANASAAAAPSPAVPASASATPNTVVFAAGAGNAAPQPAQNAVRARLVDTTNGRTYALATARLLVGRESSCDIVLPDINASRTHAEIRFEPQGVWSITDLGSTNGTHVNGHEISSQTLRPGDRLTIGMTNLVFQLA